MKKSMTIDFFIAIFIVIERVDCPDSWILNPYKTSQLYSRLLKFVCSMLVLETVYRKMK